MENSLIPIHRELSDALPAFATHHPIPKEGLMHYEPFGLLCCWLLFHLSCVNPRLRLCCHNQVHWPNPTTQTHTHTQKKKADVEKDGDGHGLIVEYL